MPTVTPEVKKTEKLTAQPIQAPFEEAPPREEVEERAPADPLEHFRKHQCANGHTNWDPANIVFSMDNKRWILKCMSCKENGVPAWYTITGSSMAIMNEVAGNAPIKK